jgi:NTP pyrophosphatase (non-canonical NTP hydrolase)
MLLSTLAARRTSPPRNTLELKNMSDDDTTVATLRRKVQSFVDARDWRQFHNPKDLSVSLCIEAAELLEEYQWLRSEEVEEASQDPEARARVAGELADVLIYALSLANTLGLDVATVVEEKLASSAHKYPAEQFRGRFRLDE